MRVKRGNDRFWKVLKYQGDGAYYATCKCGYEYCCGDILHRKTNDTWVIYLYCPYYGARKKEYNDVPIKTGIDIDEHWRKKYGG
mgnify:CR=1 FL=1